MCLAPGKRPQGPQKQTWSHLDRQFKSLGTCSAVQNGEAGPQRSNLLTLWIMERSTDRRATARPHMPKAGPLLPESKVLSMKATLLSTKEGGNVDCGDKVDWICSRASVLIPSTHSNHLRSEVTQSCLTLCNPMNCRLPGSSVHGNFQARILKWVTISFSGDLPGPGIEPRSSAL